MTIDGHIKTQNLKASNNKKYVPPRFVVSLYTNGTYLFLVNNHTWLTSSKTSLRSNGFSYNNMDKTLYLNGTYAQSGNDQMGFWQNILFNYTAYDDPNTVMECSIITYLDNDLVRFKQVFTYMYFRHV